MEERVQVQVGNLKLWKIWYGDTDWVAAKSREAVLEYLKDTYEPDELSDFEVEPVFKDIDVVLDEEDMPTMKATEIMADCDENEVSLIATTCF